MQSQIKNKQNNMYMSHLLVIKSVSRHVKGWDTFYILAAREITRIIFSGVEVKNGGVAWNMQLAEAVKWCEEDWINLLYSPYDACVVIKEKYAKDQ